MLDSWLIIIMALCLIIWVGGAISGQIWMFRAGQRGDLQLRALLIPYINWIIRFVYVPLAATAFTCGLLLVWRAGISFASPWVLFPIIVFLGTIVVGSFYSLPEYARLTKAFNAQNSGDPELQRRVEIAAWVNRIELTLVVLGLIGILAQVL
jgi:hypothetical protein